MACEPELKLFASREAMAESLSEVIGKLIERDVAQTGEATLALSGGATPEALYRKLAASALPWRNTSIVLVDERWVPPGHERSNERFVRDCFSRAAVARFIGLYEPDTSPADAAARLNQQRWPVFTAVILGMGADGHTASWFPHAEGLAEALESETPFAAIRATRSDVTGDERERVTMTMAAIRRANAVVMMLAGEDKRDAFQRACAAGPAGDMPVRAIMRARPDMLVAWAP